MEKKKKVPYGDRLQAILKKRNWRVTGFRQNTDRGMTIKGPGKHGLGTILAVLHWKGPGNYDVEWYTDEPWVIVAINNALVGAQNEK